MQFFNLIPETWAAYAQTRSDAPDEQLDNKSKISSNLSSTQLPVKMTIC